MEKLALEKTMQDKEENYAKEKGSKYMKRDDFRQYAANLREKNNGFKSMKKVLDEIKSECTVLDRTTTILKSRAQNIDEFMKDLEKKEGVQGFSAMEDQIQGVSEMTEQLDNAKSQSLQDLTALVKQIESEVKDKKQKLAPEIKKLRNLRQQFQDIEKEYNEKKKVYDQVVSTLEMEKERWERDMGSSFTEYKQSESKFHSNNVQNDIYEAFQKRISNEAKFLANPDKKLSQEFKSYQEFFNAKVSFRYA